MAAEAWWSRAADRRCVRSALTPRGRQMNPGALFSSAGRRAPTGRNDGRAGNGPIRPTTVCGYPVDGTGGFWLQWCHDFSAVERPPDLEPVVMRVLVMHCERSCQNQLPSIRKGSVLRLNRGSSWCFMLASGPGVFFITAPLANLGCLSITIRRGLDCSFP